MATTLPNPDDYLQLPAKFVRIKLKGGLVKTRMGVLTADSRNVRISELCGRGSFFAFHPTDGDGKDRDSRS